VHVNGSFGSALGSRGFSWPCTSIVFATGVFGIHCFPSYPLITYRTIQYNFGHGILEVAMYAHEPHILDRNWPLNEARRMSPRFKCWYVVCVQGIENTGITQEWCLRGTGFWV
jgi:hypothetical protein